jgi:hypothetical protein
MHFYASKSVSRFQMFVEPAGNEIAKNRSSKNPWKLIGQIDITWPEIVYLITLEFVRHWWRSAFSYDNQTEVNIQFDLLCQYLVDFLQHKMTGH